MKGFAVTPILFVGLILVVGIMLLNFMDMDFRASEGIAQEGRLNKLAGGFLGNMTSAGTRLLYYSALAATEVSNVTQLEQNITKRLGRPVQVIGCTNQTFTLYYNESYRGQEMESVIRRDYPVVKTVSCASVFQLIGKNATVDCGTALFTCGF